MKAKFTYFSGYGLGAALGLFSASVSPNITAPDAPQQTAKEIFRDLKFSTLSYAKNFAVVGLMFSAVECTIESVSNFNIIFLYRHEKLYEILSNSIEEKETGKMEPMRVVSLEG